MQVFWKTRGESFCVYFFVRQAGTWDSAAMLAPGHTLPQATKKPHETKITARICSRCRFWTKETKRPKNPTATSEEPQAKAGYGTSPLHTIPPKGWENIYATHPAQKVKNLPANAGDRASVPGSGRCPGEGNGYPLQYACLENSTDRGAWQATVHEIAKSLDMAEGPTYTYIPLQLDPWLTPYQEAAWPPLGSQRAREAVACSRSALLQEGPR